MSDKQIFISNITGFVLINIILVLVSISSFAEEQLQLVIRFTAMALALVSGYKFYKLDLLWHSLFFSVIIILIAFIALEHTFLQ